EHFSYHFKQKNHRKETGTTSEPVSPYPLSHAACDNFVKLAFSFSIHLPFHRLEAKSPKPLSFRYNY
ncbi:MAG: hypothetical protein SPC23_10440, partial [Lachnospiraceae bacterium]|nr:hypothetical protein [Lachnospiraceae bacterium]